MKAAVLESIPNQLVIDDVTLDKPRAGEVVVTIKAAGLCHSDLHFMEGKYPHPCPAVLGHECAGVVEAVGPGVTYVQPGDHVIGCLSAYCGDCDYCLTGRLFLCSGKASIDRASSDTPRLSRRGDKVNQFFRLSSFAEQVLVHEHALVKISKDMPLDRAALIGCGVTTGLGAVFNTARIPVGATVAVIGCGGIGLNCVQGARIAGAGRIIAVDMNDSKLELAQEFGATDVVNAAAVGDPIAAVKEMTKGGVEYSFEAIGLKVAAEQAFHMLARGGTATVIGMIPVGEEVSIPGYALLEGRSLQGSNMGSNRFRVDMPRYVDLYMQGRLKLDELISSRINLDQINDGFAQMKTGNIARSVIVFD
jgi:S-(hydroxymethyl)glutathione dehydrogenase / alcohol dehydrogenase